jgi:hypothetical protein
MSNCFPLACRPIKAGFSHRPILKYVPHYGPVGCVRSSAQKCDEVVQEIEV